jgi:glycerophosphoryl diester phosphodiesterase
MNRNAAARFSRLFKSWCALRTLAQLGAMLSLTSSARAVEPNVKPLAGAHSHNDYLHQRPLLDALDHGFTSVEADVFPVNGTLLIGHDRDSLRPDRTLENLYLAPLASRVAGNGGHVHHEPAKFLLLIDIKRQPKESYNLLQRLLEKYKTMLTSKENGKLRPGAITIILTGERPQITDDETGPRYVALDGRLSDLKNGSTLPADLVPMISDKWTEHFEWNGAGPMSDDERAKLRDIVAQAHAQARVVRFWATPEKESLWRELRSAGVDFINTDELDRLARFLNGADGPPQR